MKLTDEQQAVITTAGDRGHLKVEALAGTGKTSTMRALADTDPCSTLYVAFNRAVKDEAQATMPRTVTARTVHALAFRHIGDPWATRAKQNRRIKSTDIARRFGLETIWLNVGGTNKRIAAGFLGGLITRSLRRFAISADHRPGPQHVPIPRTAREDPDMLALFREIRGLITPKLAKAWNDTIRPDSDLPLDGNMLIKMWQLHSPVLPYERIIVDEAQDMNDAARSIIQAQMHLSQLVVVGDTWQQINAWNGAVNALEKFPIDRRLWLTHSFRFGPEIAETANIVLQGLGSSHRIIGVGPAGQIGTLADPDVRLSRTNALAVDAALTHLAAGRRPHIIGGASDVVDFCEGVIALQTGKPVVHPELMCFDSYGDLLAYVETDELGGDLVTLVDLIRKFGAETIVKTMKTQPPEDQADVILSTTHKIKGRQWPTVQLAEDFPASDDDPIESVRLLYVAVTRAQQHLDIDEVPYFTPTQKGNHDEQQSETGNDRRGPGPSDEPGPADCGAHTNRVLASAGDGSTKRPDVAAVVVPDPRAALDYGPHVSASRSGQPPEDFDTGEDPARNAAH